MSTLIPVCFCFFLSTSFLIGRILSSEEKSIRHLAKRQFGLGGGNCPLGLLPPLGGTIRYSQGGQLGPFLEGTTATLICPQGQLPTAGQQTSSICLNGIWQPSILAACSNLGLNLNAPLGFGLGLGGTGTLTGGGQCPFGLSPGINGNVIYSLGSQLSGPYPQGTVAQLQCFNGLLPNGPSSSTCLNGSWQPSLLGSCTAGGGGGVGGIGFGNPCLSGPGTPLNGRLSYSNGGLLGPFPAGTVASVLCNAGYVLSGQSSATCQNGQFNPNILGTCVPA